MSARNGDKSRFNRLRKQKIARRKCAYELLDRMAKSLNPGKVTRRTHPKPVAA